MININYLHQTQTEIKEIVDKANVKDFTELFCFLSERISKPESYVVMLGETSSGKTTLINGLLSENVLKTSARPTTGTIVEIMDGSETNGYEYCAVNKDATIKTLQKEDFDKLSQQPYSDLLRLQLKVPNFPYSLKHLRLFDTPGYNSLCSEHDEVLKEFIPNADIILYVVSYKDGFKESDNQFMQFIEQLIKDDTNQKDTEFFLIINRTPLEIKNNDKGILATIQHAEDCLHRKLPVYIVNTEIKGEDSYNKPILPSAKELWEDVSKALISPRRQKALLFSYLNYQKDFLLDLQVYFEKILLKYQISEEEKKDFETEQNKLFQKKDIIDEKIKTTFARINSKLDKLFDKSHDKIYKKICNEIDSTSKWTKDECVSFINAHLLYLYIKEETKIISDYIQGELEQLDKEINDIINNAVIDFERAVTVKSNLLGKFATKVGNKLGQKMLGYSLKGFFAQFGGAGGPGAGVANAAKKGLKKLGELIGKKFSRETHNALAHFLKKIGATSTKAITTAAIVIVEAAFIIYDLVTWQNDLKKGVNKGLTEWKNETIKIVRENLVELENTNYQNIQSYFEYLKDSFTTEESKTSEITLDDAKQLSTKVEILLNKVENQIKKEVENG